MMKVTMEYIAKMANVSKATVSRVINNKDEGVGEATKQRVLEVIERYHYKDYYEGKPDKKGKTRTIGAIIPDISNPFFSELFKIIDGYLSNSDYTLFLCNTDSSIKKEHACIQTLIALNVDGVILVPTVGEQKEGCENLKKYNIPYVLLDRKLRTTTAPASVYIDNEYAMFVATEYLINNRNTDIAILLGPSFLSASEERLNGYYSAMKQYGLNINKKLIHWGDFTYESGYNATIYLIESGNEFTSILATSDVMALGVLRALEDKNYKVPDDIEVIGFDNIRISNMVSPALTTMEQPIQEMGIKAAEALMRIIDNKSIDTINYRLEAKLIARKSTK